MLHRSARPLFLAATALALTGCLDMDVHTKLEADGSGTMAMKLGLTDGFVKIVKKLKELDPKDDTANTDEIVFEAPTAEEKAAMKAAGCELLEFEGENSDEKVFSRFKVAFERLGALSQLETMRPDAAQGKSGPASGMTLVKNADGTYTLSMGNDDDEAVEEVEGVEEGMESGAEESEEAGEDEDPEAAMQKAAAAMELMGQMMAEMANLKIVVGMEVPGEVVSFTPATLGKQDGGKVTWTIDMQNAMGGAGMEEGFSVTFKMPEGTSIPEAALTPVKAAEAETEER